MFNKAVITAKGLALDAKVSAGQTNAVFTAIKLGNGSYSDTEDLSAVTAMKSIKQTFGISSIAVIENNTVRLRSVIDNLGVEEGYYISEVGIYAQDPDYGEILYSIATGVKNKMDYQPSETELEGATSTFDTYTTISNSVNASISMGTGAMASAEDVEELRNGKVDTTGGNISETVIETLDTVEDKYPVPAAGESVKRFFGKVLTFLRNIRPLTGDANIYVSTTGSDILGDGTQSKPFKTIQFAINTLPKDFGGYFATITISAGTYVEDIFISGFSGTLQFTLLGNVTTGSITIGNSRVTCTASTACTLSIKYLYVTASGRFDSFVAVGITTTGYIENQPVWGGKASITSNRGDIYISGPITLTGNTDVGIASIAVSRIYFVTVSGSGFNVGLFVANGSVIYVGSSASSLSAATPVQHSSGGMIINSNGTQISDDIIFGLSCTWGTIRSGYVRHGNYNSAGSAMISINCRIESISALTAGTMYTISGFPAPSIPNFSTVSACTDMPGRTSECWISPTGTINFKPNVNVAAGSWNITLSATYKTNS